MRNLDEERDGTGSSSGKLGVSNNMDSLLRLFRSDFFDAFMAVTYLYRYRETVGVHDYLCNELYVLADADLEVFMPQLCNLLVFHAPNSPGLERFVMDKCASSMHFSVQVYWFLQAAVEDAAREKNKEAEDRCRYLRTHCETSAVNGSQLALRSILSSHYCNTLSKVTRNAGPRNDTIASDPDPDGNALPRNPTKVDVNESIVEEELGKSTICTSHQDDSIQTVITNGGDVPVVNSEEVFGQNSAAKESSPQCTNLPSDESPIEDRNNKALKNDKENITNTSMHGNAKPQRKDSPVNMEASSMDKGSSEKPNTTTQPSENLETNGEIENANPCESKVASIDSEANMESDDEKAMANLVQKNTSIESNGGYATRESMVSRNREKILKADVGAFQSLDMDALELVRMKQERFDYFQDSLAIIKHLVQLSLSTRDQPETARQSHLVNGLQSVNEMLLRRMSGESAEPLVAGTPAPDPKDIVDLGNKAALRSIHLPLTRANSQVLRILHVHQDESVILTSRTRCPYLLYVEVLPTPMTCADRLVFCEHMGVAHTPDPQQEKRKLSSSQAPKVVNWQFGCAEDIPNSEDITATPVSESGSALNKSRRRKLSEMTPVERQRANVRAIIYGDPYSEQPNAFEDADREERMKRMSYPEIKSRQAVLLGVFGELWSWKENRILKKSPFGALKGTKLKSFIVKAGDDLRQEQLAIQLIKQFELIFKEEKVDVYLRSFTVMSVSSDAGLVEVVPDSVSVHKLKEKTPNFKSLLDYFERAYGKMGSISFRAAQRRFIRSMAGYSLVCYLLQIKDRHNGNIMIDARGHIVHIDFGFMLTNSPGAIKFENAPFKLTEEYLQVICGMKNVQDINETSKTEGYRYFQELFVLGLLAARKHHDKITTLVRIMMEGTSMPCMAAGSATIEGLEQRFALGMPEKQCINHAISLIESSRLSLRSVGYDRFQAYSNGYR